jgi:soluble lytic murein transglycosylase-like protein
VNVGILSALAALGMGAAYLFFKNSSLSAAGGSLNLAGGGDLSSSPAGDGGTASPAKKSGLGNEWDDLIAQAAAKQGIPPVVLKAIVAKESFFNPNAINPEKNFILNGASYQQYDRSGDRALAAWIADGNDPATIGVNPSLGLGQVRVSEGKKFIGGLDAWDLFDPATNLEAAASLLAELFNSGITLDTIDAYNVGLGGNWQRGIRSLGYRDDVNKYAQKFAGDF